MHLVWFPTKKSESFMVSRTGASGPYRITSWVVQSFPAPLLEILYLERKPVALNLSQPGLLKVCSRTLLSEILWGPPYSAYVTVWGQIFFTHINQNNISPQTDWRDSHQIWAVFYDIRHWRNLPLSSLNPFVLEKLFFIQKKKKVKIEQASCYF